MARTPGILGERVIRKLIKQLSDSISKKTPLDKQREVLKQIMSLREELQAGAMIYKQRRDRRRATEGTTKKSGDEIPADNMLKTQT